MGKDLNGKELGSHISQRKDGRYQARATVNGKRIELIKKDLKQLKKEFEEKRALALRYEKNIRPNETLNSWYAEWFDRCKKPTLKNEIAAQKYDQKARNSYIRILGDKKLIDITQVNIQDATNQLSDEGLIDRSISNCLAVLRQCLDAAVANKLMSFNPCVGIIVKKGKPMAERRVLELWEQELLIECSSSTPYKEAYMTLLLTGMRIGELSGLQWEDIDFNKKEIHIERSLTVGYINGEKTELLTLPKTSNSIRIIPFFGDIENHLLSQKEKQDLWKKKLGKRWRCPDDLGNLVFTTTYGSPLSKYPLANATKGLIKTMQLRENENAGKEGRTPRKVEHIYPHAFRHTFATRCFECNMDAFFVQKIMGHANYSTTISYTHILESKKQFEISKGFDLLKTEKEENSNTIKLSKINEHLYNSYRPSSAF